MDSKQGILPENNTPVHVVNLQNYPTQQYQIVTNNTNVTSVTDQNMTVASSASNGLYTTNDQSGVFYIANGNFNGTEMMLSSDGTTLIPVQQTIPNVNNQYVMMVPQNDLGVSQVDPTLNQIVTTDPNLISAGQHQALEAVNGTDQIPAEEPFYVNAKQFHRIIKRREARARLETQGLIPKERAKYLHESRHKHAMNRQRGSGGRFYSLDKDGQPTQGSSSSINGKQPRTQTTYPVQRTPMQQTQILSGNTPYSFNGQLMTKNVVYL